MLRSILAQLCLGSERVPESITSLRRENSQPNLAALIAALLSSLESDQTYYIILDALDESTEREDLMEVLSEFMKNQVDRLHLLMTSRKERQLEETLGVIVTRKVPIQTLNVDADIALHVRRCLDVDKRLSNWPGPIRKEIEVALTEGAQGM